MTTWLGALKLTASTTSPFVESAHALRTASSARPRIAAIAPVPRGTASCIACARKTHQRQRIPERQNAGGHERRVLAEAVPCDQHRLGTTDIEPRAIDRV